MSTEAASRPRTGTRVFDHLVPYGELKRSLQFNPYDGLSFEEERLFMQEMLSPEFVWEMLPEAYLEARFRQFHLLDAEGKCQCEQDLSSASLCEKLEHLVACERKRGGECSRCQCIRPRLFQAVFVRSIDMSAPVIVEYDTSYFVINTVAPFPLDSAASPIDPVGKPLVGVRFGIIMKGSCLSCRLQQPGSIFDWDKQSHTTGTITRVKLDATRCEIQLLPGGNRCSACGKVGTQVEQLFHCGGKCGVMYCDRRCQKQGWKIHKPLCKQLAAHRESSSVVFEDSPCGSKVTLER